MLRAVTVGWVLLGAAALVRVLITARRPRSGWARFLPLAALALMVVHVWACLRHSPFAMLFALPGYVATLSHVVLAAVPGRWWPGPALLRRALAAVGLLFLGFSSLRLAQFDVRRARVAAFAQVLRAEPRSFDLSGLSWTGAFDALVEKLEAEYPFTDWKAIDWPRLHAEIRPGIARAEETKDRRAYYRGLRELARRMPDGHVELVGDDGGLRREEVGGHFGLSLAELHDGRVIVDRVEPESGAARQGVGVGEEVVSWNGEPIEAAVSKVSLLWTEDQAATAEGQRLQRLLLLSRGPIGARAELVLGGAGSGGRRVALTAEDRPERETGENAIAAVLFGCPVEWRTAEGGVGYVRIRHELPTLRCPAPEAVLARAIASFEASHAPGMVVDLRDNFGGEDALVARLAAFFVTEERFYERPAVFDPRTRRFAPAAHVALAVEPAEPHYEGKVVLLIDARTLSSGEGLPMLLKGARNVTLLGFEGTHGSFAINQKEVQLPEGLTFRFPQARSVDDQGRIQVDSDATGKGGVVPDIRVPRDAATLDAIRSGHDVLLERAVQLLGARRAD
jgi:carboxyl-terminal processing protease